MFYFIFSTNPSIPLLWAAAANVIEYMRISKVDKEFDTIMEDAEEFDMPKEEEPISVAYLEDTAYWVLDNTFYQADIVDGYVDKESSRPVDVFEMSNGDLLKMLYILDNLTEG